jgi:hypothetical protein
MFNFLVRKCKESNTFAWCITFVGIALMILIAFW